MTPAARLAAAIDILDNYLAGAALEQSLTNWARRSRFAGSKDRAAIRDIVFDCVRCRRSFSAIGGSLTGRGLTLGWTEVSDFEIPELFGSQKYGPSTITPEEAAALTPFDKLEKNIQFDLPQQLSEQLQKSLGPKLDNVLSACRSRAPICIRISGTVDQQKYVVGQLTEENIDLSPVSNVQGAYIATRNAQRLRISMAYKSGLFEFQDANSQRVVLELPLSDQTRILDLCAGGGGKTLAIADKVNSTVLASDINPKRLNGLIERRKRSGARIEIMNYDELGDHEPWDLVLVDAPCTGSGTWRRNPEAKWTTTPKDVQRFSEIQSQVLDKAASLCESNGTIAYVTCSLLHDENELQAESFLARYPSFSQVSQINLLPNDVGDGFFMTLFKNGDFS